MTMLNKFHFIQFNLFRFVSFHFNSISLHTWSNCWNEAYVLSQRRPLTPSGHLHFTPPPVILVHIPSCRHVTSAHVSSPVNTQLWNQAYTRIDLKYEEIWRNSNKNIYTDAAWETVPVSWINVCSTSQLLSTQSQSCDIHQILLCQQYW